jgi:hypothetical protein
MNRAIIHHSTSKIQTNERFHLLDLDTKSFEYFFNFTYSVNPNRFTLLFIMPEYRTGHFLVGFKTILDDLRIVIVRATRGFPLFRISFNYFILGYFQGQVSDVSGNPSKPLVYPVR